MTEELTPLEVSVYDGSIPLPLEVVQRYKFKKAVLGSKTDKAPGPEIGNLKWRATERRFFVHRINRVALCCTERLFLARDLWPGSMQGGPARDDKFCELQAWVDYLKEQDHIRYQMLWHFEQKGFDRAMIRNMSSAFDIAEASKKIWDEIRVGTTVWHLAIKNWSEPKASLKEWCDYLQGLLNERDEANAKLQEYVNEMAALGWDYKNMRWIHFNNPIWERLHDEMQRAAAVQPAAAVQRATRVQPGRAAKRRRIN
jgi:hypothetical protein